MYWFQSIAEQYLVFENTYGVNVLKKVHVLLQSNHRDLVYGQKV